MRRRAFRVTVVLSMFAVCGVTALAQRGSIFGRQRGRSQPRASNYTPNLPYDGKFTFVRMSYPTWGRGQPPWEHDYPFGEQNFMTIFTTITNTPAHALQSNIFAFGDPEVFKYPVIYLCEPGDWDLSTEDAVSLRDYLVKGGFLIVDDFPRQAWGNFDLQMSKAFPTAQWIELGPEHPIFNSFFEIDPYTVLASYNLGGQPAFYGLFENNDPTKRMYAVANYQNDLSEFWEASSSGYQIVSESNEAYKIGINQFIYAITH